MVLLFTVLVVLSACTITPCLLRTVRNTFGSHLWLLKCFLIAWLTSSGARPFDQEKSLADVKTLINRLHSPDDNVEKSAAEDLIARAETAPEAAVEALTNVLTEEDAKSPKLREWAAYALAKIAWGTARTESRLLDLVAAGTGTSDRHKSDTAAVAAWAIGHIGEVPDEPQAVWVLLNALKQDGHPHLQENAAFALGALAPNSPSVVNGLVEVLQRSNHAMLKRSVAEALRRFGAGAESAIPGLVQAAVDVGNGPQVKAAALNSLMDIAKALRNKTNLSTVKTLKEAQGHLKEAFEGHESLLTQRTVTVIDDTVNSIQDHSPKYFLMQHPVAISIPALIFAYCLWALLLKLVVLRHSPMLVLRFYEWLPLMDVPLPKSVFGETKIGLRQFLTAGQQYDSRVLDAWVGNHAVAARKSIESLRERDHSSYIPLPVELNHKICTDFSIKSLQEECARPTWSISIVGEGGLGKTTLAYEIALWSLDPGKQSRLCESHLMIPVVLELSSASDSLKSYAALQDEIRVQLKAITAEEQVPSEALCEYLLRRRRLLLVLDNASESFQEGIDSKTREVVNALVITSRLDGKATRRAGIRIKPRHIRNRALFRLIDHYMETYGRELTIDEMSGLAGKIKHVLGENRNCTPLLAKMFAQHLINIASGDAEERAVTNVPDLFLEYICFLNRERGLTDPEHAVVHSACKIVAWKCIEKRYAPTPCSKTEVAEELTNSNHNPEIVPYLQKLGIISISGDEERIAFSTDTVAEYLAALHVVQYTQAPEQWQEFIKTARGIPGAPQATRGFLAAVYDCINTKVDGARPPEWLRSELLNMIQTEDAQPQYLESNARKAIA